ncbi:MAG: hypothetical protein KME54_22145 [Tolypothrix brevis GSE-NOS-MK-07-07A]|jgi:hypothetical protein|nr:hypothetical protein [Tolypothrix brevis GSE-NOS-MK-07-07A]
MSKPFNQNLYSSCRKACEERGVPEDLTEKASMIIASDEALKPDLGRTPEDQEVMKQVLPYLQSGGKTE